MNLLLALSLSLFMPAAEPDPPQCVLVVVGAPGAPEFAPQFDQWADRWRTAAETAGADFVRVDRRDAQESDDRRRLEQAIEEHIDRPAALWLVLIGHGTYDGREAKFNLDGPDVSAEELAAWLSGRTGPTAVINCASASAPFVNHLSADNRVIVSATKSGYEYNFARFGQHISQTIIDPAADLDKDDQVSLLEAFLTAATRVKEFYDQEARLATEHPLIDDNGDALGTPADWFRGIRATQRAQEGASPDGLRAHQFHLIRSEREARLPAEVRQRRDELELAIAALRDEKTALPEDEYYARLETLLLELARLYAGLDEAPGDPLAPAVDAKK
jgi:hypothetical protein